MQRVKASKLSKDYRFPGDSLSKAVLTRVPMAKYSTAMT